MDPSLLIEPLVYSAGMTAALVGWALISERRADAGPVTDEAARARLEALAARVGVRARFRLMRAPGERIAAIASITGRVYVTPETATGDAGAPTEFIVLHELAHMARRDGWRFLGALVPATALWCACALLVSATWVGPLLFVATFMACLGALRKRVECAADARAAAWMGDPRAAVDAMVRALRLNHPDQPLLPLLERSSFHAERLKRMAALAGMGDEELRDAISGTGDARDDD